MLIFFFFFYCGCMSVLQKQRYLPRTIKLLMCHGMVSVSVANRGQNGLLWELVGTHNWPLHWNYSRTHCQASNLIIYRECEIMTQRFFVHALWLSNIIDLCATDTQHVLCNLISCDFKLQAKYFSANHLRVHLAACAMACLVINVVVVAMLTMLLSGLQGDRHAHTHIHTYIHKHCLQEDLPGGLM